MNKQLQYFLMACLGMFLTAACAVRKTEPFTNEVAPPSVSATGKTDNPTHFSNEKVVQGHKVFMSFCYKCHPSGEAGLAPEVLGKPGFAIRMQVRHGFGAMPAFKKNRISKDDLNALIAYIKAQKKL